MMSKKRVYACCLYVSVTLYGMDKRVPLITNEEDDDLGFFDYESSYFLRNDSSEKVFFYSEESGSDDDLGPQDDYLPPTPLSRRSSGENIFEYSVPPRLSGQVRIYAKVHSMRCKIKKILKSITLCCFP